MLRRAPLVMVFVSGFRHELGRPLAYLFFLEEAPVFDKGLKRG